RYPPTNGIEALSCRSADSPPHEVLRDEPDVLLPLAKAAGEVGKPLRAVRDVHAHVVALAAKLDLLLRPETVEHLELEAIRRNALLHHELFCRVDQAVVVGGNAGVRRLFDEHLHVFNEPLPDLTHPLIRYLRRLLVRSFAEPDARLHLTHAPDVFRGPLQIGLEYDSDVF